MMYRFLCAALTALVLSGQGRADVTVRGELVLVDGEPFVARGAAGERRLDLLKQLGATAVRTYGEETGAVLAEAERLGLKVVAGFWLEHPRRGFNYNDPAQVAAQNAALERFVRAYKDHPALLLWGLGNEVEAELADDAVVWPAIEAAAQLVKSIDPAHPTMAVIAETGNDKVGKVMRQAPSIDVLGVNSYGPALPSVADRAREAGWRGPLLITELGPLGQWQAAKTPWGAAIEPSSTAKAALLRDYLAALTPRTQGHFVFYWGQKQEVTPTWHSLLLPSGEWTETAEAMAASWGGTTPDGNHAPRIHRFAFAGGESWPAGQVGRAELEASDPDGDALAAEWLVMAESTDLRKAGDAESVPASFPAAVREASTKGVTITGLAPGRYRLFLTLRDGRGAAATANLPFELR